MRTRCLRAARRALSSPAASAAALRSPLVARKRLGLRPPGSKGGGVVSYGARGLPAGGCGPARPRHRVLRGAALRGRCGAASGGRGCRPLPAAAAASASLPRTLPLPSPARAASGRAVSGRGSPPSSIRGPPLSLTLCPALQRCQPPPRG